jgi:hypothetical protein
VRGGPGSIVAPAAADRGLDLGEFGRLLNSGKIEDLRKIAECRDEKRDDEQGESERAFGASRLSVSALRPGRLEHINVVD